MTQEQYKIANLSFKIREMKAALDSCYITEWKGYNTLGQNVQMKRCYFDAEKVATARGTEITWHPINKSK